MGADEAFFFMAVEIFDGLQSFRELEARIRALATPYERGAVFVIFVEAYLATLAVEKAMQGGVADPI